MAAPALQEAATEQGLEVELLGCPLEDCSYREGSAHAAARLAGTRPPRLRKAFAEAPISMTTAPPGRSDRRRPVSGSPEHRRPSLRAAAPLVALTVAVAGISILVSRAVYDVGESEQAAITVSLDHRAGVPLIGEEGIDAAPTGERPRLKVVIDGATRLDRAVPLTSADSPDTALFWERFIVAPGTHELRIELSDGAATPTRILFADTVAMEAGEALLLDYRDQEVVIAADAGRRVFNSRTQGARSGCAICHSLEPDTVLVGPSLYGIADRAGQTVAGLDAASYLRESLVDPDAYVVPGYPAGQMLPDLAEVLTGAEIDQLVAFMLTLEEQ
jgi:cytochrome c551/c552